MTDLRQAGPPPSPRDADIPAGVAAGIRLAAAAAIVNLALALVKIIAGIVGNAFALVADGIESIADVVSSIIVTAGLRIAVKPPDEDHPFGHGKAESLAALLVSGALLVAAGLIAWHSVLEIMVPHQSPAWFTLPVLVGVIGVKWLLYRRAGVMGRELHSSSLESESWHHLSDALTSMAAFVGISIALAGGPGWEAADDWAALFACIIIATNAVRLLRNALGEVMDAAVAPDTVQQIRRMAGAVEHVEGIEKCRVRKSGLALLADIHVEVDGELTVTEGHEIARAVKRTLLESDLPVMDVLVHIEPAGRDGNHNGQSSPPSPPP